MNVKIIFQSWLLSVGLIVQFIACGLAQTPIRQTWEIDGVTREAQVYIPAQAKSQPVPVVFAFHGHGGSMANAVRSFHYHRDWPEAISVYMQGLNTPGQLTDPEGKRPGWQKALGDQNDRDLKFFDQVLSWLQRNYQVDESRIYAMGHSNGGGFTYLLWAERGSLLAAVAPSGSPATRSRGKLKPKPVLHTAGENDPLVKFAWQKVTIDHLIELNQCAPTPHVDGSMSIYESPIGCPVITYITVGGHKFPGEVIPKTVAFFKQYALSPVGKHE